MNWETFYLTSFVVGFLLSAVSFLAGGLHLGHIHVHGHFHGHRGGALFNLGTAAAFLAWFGGAGYLLLHAGVLGWVGLLVAIVTGLAGAALVFWFLAKLMSTEKPLDPADYEMIGVLGRVASPIRANGTGEILFMRDGSRKAAAARSEDQSAIPRDVEVIVTRYEKGIAYVRRWEEFS